MRRLGDGGAREEALEDDGFEDESHAPDGREMVFTYDGQRVPFSTFFGDMGIYHATDWPDADEQVDDEDADVDLVVELGIGQKVDVWQSYVDDGGIGERVERAEPRFASQWEDIWTQAMGQLPKGGRDDVLVSDMLLARGQRLDAASRITISEWDEFLDSGEVDTSLTE